MNDEQPDPIGRIDSTVSFDAPADRSMMVTVWPIYDDNRAASTSNS